MNGRDIHAARALRRMTMAAVAVAVAACTPEMSTELPPEETLAATYGETARVTLDGNVAEVRVTQSPEQLRRGGPIWAKAGPYIYLFTPQTQALFNDYGGLGGIRVTTLDGRGDLVARALLKRGTLNSATWPRAINVAGRARVDGTTRPQTMVDLAEYGQEHTDYEYSQKYAGSN
ncbi:MAG: hypothetical protein ACR2GQ_02805 [Gemmatimonadota bacterium]